jgi:hypothetical protein
MELVNFEVMQREVGEWAQRNFGDQPPVNPLVGMVEELCEVEIASVEADRISMSKEIGDVMIYMAHFCYLRGWSLLEAWDGRLVPEGSQRSLHLVHCILWLSKHYLKGNQNIRGGTSSHDAALKIALHFICFTLESYAESAGLVVLDSIGQRWETIKRRDWVKNPDTAAEVADLLHGQAQRDLDASAMADLGKHVDMQAPVGQPSWMKALAAETQREIDKAILGPEFVLGDKAGSSG